MLARLDGTLTGAAAGAPEDVALRYVAANIGRARTRRAPTSTRCSRPQVTTRGRDHEVRWRQAVDGIPAVDSELRVNLDRATAHPERARRARARPRRRHHAARWTRARRCARCRTRVGVYRAVPRDRGPAGATRATTYADGTTAELALDDGRLTWRVTYRASSTAVYDAFVDARTGHVRPTREPGQVRRAGARSGRATRARRSGGTAHDAEPEHARLADRRRDTSERPERARVLRPQRRRRRRRRGDRRRRVGTFDSAFTPFSGTRLRRVASRARGTRRGRTAGTTNRAPERACRPSTSPTASTTTSPRRRSASRGAGSFDGRSDPVLLQTDDGAATRAGRPARQQREHVHAAGRQQSPVMQMYLWRPPNFRAMNGGDDASIVYHEYTHGLSNRLVTDASGARRAELAAGRRDGRGLERLVREGLPRRAVPGARQRRVGRGRHGRLHRRRRRTRSARQALDCPVGASPAPCPARRQRRLGRLHLRRLRQGRRRAGGPRRRRDLGADAVGPADARSARPARAAADHAGRCGCRRRSRRSWTCATRSCRPTRPRAARGATRSGPCSPPRHGLLRVDDDADDARRSRTSRCRRRRRPARADRGHA